MRMDKKEEILNAAAALFAAEGCAFSMSALAQAVNIRTPSLYSHFESKEQLLALVIRRAIAECRASLERFARAQAGQPAGARLEALFWHLLGYFGEDSRLGLWKNMMLVNEPALRTLCLEELLKQNAWFTRRLTRCFRDGAHSGELRRADRGAVALYYSMIQGLLDVMLLSRGGGFNFDAYAHRAWDAFWDGVRAR